VSSKIAWREDFYCKKNKGFNYTLTFNLIEKLSLALFLLALQLEKLMN